MATSLRLKSPSLESFEETYKTAYSHGLEAIYALEAVDLRTVKKLVPATRKTSVKSIVETYSASEMPYQLEFVFGESAEEWIDCASLILSITAGMPQKKLSQLLKEFDLDDVAPLQKDLFKQNVSSFPDATQKELCFVKLKKIAQTFLLPWIESKRGLCSQEEIIERLENVSAQPELLRPTLEFVKKHFTNELFPFAPFLCHIEEELFAHAKFIFDDYRTIVDRARSYFPSKKERYTLASLQAFVEKEFAKQWIYYDPAFISETLHRSSLFSIFRDPKGILQICLA